MTISIGHQLTNPSSLSLGGEGEIVNYNLNENGNKLSKDNRDRDNREIQNDEVSDLDMMEADIDALTGAGENTFCNFGFEFKINLILFIYPLNALDFPNFSSSIIYRKLKSSNANQLIIFFPPQICHQLI